MDGGVGIILVTTLGLFALSGALCIGCFCCCCAYPIYKLFLYVYRKFNPKKDESSKDKQYQSLQTAENLEGGYHSLPTATPTFINADEQIAHAYLVPPLIDIHTSNYNNIIENSNNHNNGSKEEMTPFRDVWAALLFGVNVIVVYYFGIQSLFVSDDFNSSITDTSATSVLSTVIIFALILTAFATVVGSIGMAYLVKHSDTIIEFLMYANITMLTITAIISIFTLQIIGAIIFGVLACLSYWYLQSVRSRIPFASAVLNIASSVLRDNYTGLILTAYTALAIQVVWFILWTAAVAGIMKVMNASTADDESREGAGGLVIFISLLSLYWGIQMIQCVVQTTVCGTLACWWFQPQRESPVRGSLFRAITTSLGSVCLGSLIVAFIQAIREMLHMMKTQAQRSHGRNHNNRGLAVCVISITECLMRYVEEAVRYFNKYAFCYVAAYGLGFVESGKQVTSLFTKRGWTAIINDNLISRTFFCGIAALAVCTSLAGLALSLVLDMFLAHSFQDAAALAGWGMLVGLIIGGIVAMVLTNTLDSAVAMVFVCFAEDPFTLQNNHYDEYINLSTRWQEMHPHTMDWNGGGNNMYAQPELSTTPVNGTAMTPVVTAVPAEQHNSSKLSKQTYITSSHSQVIGTPVMDVHSSNNIYQIKDPSAPPL